MKKAFPHRFCTADLYAYERTLIQEMGPFKWVAGADESGAGSLIGPLVAAAVILPDEDMIDGLNDSKKLTPAKREALYEQIQSRAIAVSVVQFSAAEVDTLNIYQASLQALAQAVNTLSVAPQLALVDARTLPHLKIPQRAIIKGDALCASIAAASIVAKVHRDRIMLELHERYPLYGLGQHKGYGTQKHLAALLEHGPCPEHRKSYAPVKALLWNRPADAVDSSCEI